MLPKSRNVKGRSLVIAPRITKRHAAKPNLLCSYDDASVPAAPESAHECVLSVGCPSLPAVTSNPVSPTSGASKGTGTACGSMAVPHRGVAFSTFPFQRRSFWRRPSSSSCCLPSSNSTILRCALRKEAIYFSIKAEVEG